MPLIPREALERKLAELQQDLKELQEENNDLLYLLAVQEEQELADSLMELLNSQPLPKESWVASLTTNEH